MTLRTTVLPMIISALAFPAAAQDVLGTASFVANGAAQTITQSASEAAETRYFNPTASCSDFCIAPQSINRNIENVGEAEVLEFLTSTVAIGRGLLIDARASTGRERGFIAASINMPAALLNEDNPYAEDILVAMGATKTDAGLSFSAALPVVVFDDGPMANDAQTLIESLIRADYPAAQIRYYRGGMLTWSALGLSIEEP